MKKAIIYSIGFITVLPLVSLIYLSFVTRWSFPGLFSEVFTLSNWHQAIEGSGGIAGSLFLSLGISGSLALISTFFGFFVSRNIMLEEKNQVLLKSAFLPYTIAPVVMGAMMQYYFIKIGISGSISGVMIAQLLFILPYSVLLLSTFWSVRIKHMIYQAKTLGASDQVVNRTILLPLSRPWLFLCFVQCFLISWFEYGMTRLVGVGKVETLTIKVMLFIEEANPYLAAVAACLMIFPVLLLLIINGKLVAMRAMNS